MCKPEPAKVAVLCGRDKDGALQPVSSVFGVAAEQMVDRASRDGLAVSQDGELLQDLLRKQGGEACVPVRIYELMAAVIDFAQVLNEARVNPAVVVAGTGGQEEPETAES